MSRYQQSSNPFDDDEEGDGGDFVMVRNEKSATTSASGSTKATGSSYNSYSSKTNASSSATNTRSVGQSRPPYQSSSDPYSSHWNKSTDDDNPFEHRRQHLQNQIENSENNQLESTQRALASIYDSEAMGIATADELMRQADTINNIESKTDTINQNLKTSQKHINNIRSIFGGIKNWWQGDKDKKATDQQEERTTANLKNAMENSQNSQPSKPDFSGFYEEDGDLDSQFMARAPKQPSGQYAFIQPVTRTAREEEVDQNLVMMSDGMSRLKGLAMGLGGEIERQNEQLDRVNNKTTTADTKMIDQNREMRRILKK